MTKLEERDAILDLVAWKGDEVVLDVGCGRGLMMVGAARRLTTGRAVGVDIWSERDQSDNLEIAAITNAQIEGVIDLVSVQTADMRQLPFADHSFDVIVSNWVVHNVEPQEERAKALSEMMRVLRPNGTILLADIVNRQEYLTEFSRLGMSNTRLVVRSVWRDWFCRTVSFGAFQPATIVAHK